jgi:mono/diheme cytochrome c family protein
MRRAVLIFLVLLAGCDDMTSQKRNDAYTSKETAPGPVPDDIVQRDGPSGHAPRLTLALIQHGQERFRIYCTPCHSELGDGHGMVVQRGFPPPPSYHIDRLRQAPTQHFYDVITNGYGAMYSFAQRVPPADRWAIAAYVRALQHSMDVPAASLTSQQRASLP